MYRFGITVVIALIVVSAHAFDSEARNERAVEMSSSALKSIRDASPLPIRLSELTQTVDDSSESRNTASSSDITLIEESLPRDKSVLVDHALRDLSTTEGSNIDCTTSSSDFGSSTSCLSRNPRKADAINDLEAQASGLALLNRRSTSESLAVTFILLSSYTNETFANALCNNANASTTDALTISSSATVYYTLPLCVASWTSLKTLTASRLLVTAWPQLPSSITSLYLSNCRFAYDGSSASSESFDSSTGYVVWDKAWSSLPQLSAFFFQTVDMKALMPTALPLSVTDFRIRSTLWPLGPIPSTLLSNYAGLYGTSNTLMISLISCGINGSLPADLLNPVLGKKFYTFGLELTLNSLSGSIPDGFFLPLQPSAVTQFAFMVALNKLSGPIPIFPALWASNSVSSILLSGNQFTGPLPPNLFGNLTFARSVTFDASNNKLAGSLPASFFGSWATVGADGFSLDLSSNSITGEIPPEFLTSSLSGSSVTFSGTISLKFNQNQLTGTIPSAFLYIPSKRRSSAQDVGYSAQNGDNSALKFETDLDASNSLRSKRGPLGSASTVYISAYTVEFDFSSNNLTGSIPDDLFNKMTSPSTVLTLAVPSNKLSGTFPDLLTGFLNTPSSLTVTADGNQIWGDAPTYCHGVATVSYSLTNNQLNGSIPSTYVQDCSSLTMRLGSNTNLAGQIPDALFSVPTLTLLAQNTSLSGTIPQNLTSTTATVYLGHTSIDFCSVPLKASSASFFTSTKCNLDYTSAACNCPQSYGSCSLQCSPPSTPSSPASVPTSAPTSSPAPSGCDPKTRPGLEFNCINGVWTANSTSSPVLTIPSGAGVVVVEGNVSSSTIIINGIGSKIIVGGCASNLSLIVIELSPEQVKELESTKSLQSLLTLSNRTDCTTNLNDVTLVTRSLNGCRKVSTRKAVSEDGKTLGAFFTVDSGGCNRWWIILVSVIAGVVVVGVAVAIVARVVWQNKRQDKYSSRLSSGLKG